MNNAKVKRNIEIVKLRDNTGLSFAKIGEQMNISKQMAHKVYNQTRLKMSRSSELPN